MVNRYSYFIIVCLLLFSSVASAGTLINPFAFGGGAGEPNTELGYTVTTGTSAYPSSGRRIEITVPAGGTTISHGYLYTSSTDDTTFTMGIYSTDGTQQGACSNSSAIIAAEGWYEVTWTSPIFLSAGTYYIQNHPTDSLTYFYNTFGSNNAFGADACGTMFTNTSSNITPMTVANYDAR